jgi:nitrile hydratase
MSYRTHADLGGRDMPGNIVPEPEDERFHAAWEPGALALTLAMGATGAWNIDMSRSARETLPDYAHLSYYAIWLAALTRMLEERDLVHADELAAGRMLHPAAPLSRVLHAADVAAVLARGTPTQRPATHPARFGVGDAVRTRDAQASHHTRLPGYARGRTGRIEAVRGMHVFADAHARGLGESPQWLYSVAFDGRALWGAQASAGSSVAIDAWEPYLEAAS